MDLKDQLKLIADRTKHKESIQTEEATKNAFVMPFLQSLGYDVFNPLEVVPEFIADIGIKKGEITRVFEKGFTGENGRIINKKSTGIGLYLCQKLCNKLGFGIELNSKREIGTEVRIIFPKSSYINL